MTPPTPLETDTSVTSTWHLLQEHKTRSAPIPITTKPNKRQDASIHSNDNQETRQDTRPTQDNMPPKTNTRNKTRHKTRQPRHSADHNKTQANTRQPNSTTRQEWPTPLGAVMKGRRDELRYSTSQQSSLPNITPCYYFHSQLYQEGKRQLPQSP